jgi:hypothetical protein
MAYTVYELATLAHGVYYRDRTSVGDWRRKAEFGQDASGGFYASLYTRGTLSVLAFRGTDEPWDYGPDTEILLGTIPGQLGDAQLAVNGSKRGLAGGSLVFTGHSLGGALACLMAAKTRTPCVTFNAPGVARGYALAARMPLLAPDPISPIIAGAVALASVDTSKIINIRANYDVVSLGTGPRLGRVDTISVAGCRAVTVEKRKESLGSLLLSPGVMVVEGMALTAEITGKTVTFVACQHKMELMEAAVKNMPEYRKDLGW